MQNNQLGVSAYDYRYGTCRCVYCNQPVILRNTPDTLDLLFRDELEKLKATQGDQFYLTLAEEKQLRDEILQRESGQSIGYEQCIHYRCLAIIQRPENKEILERITLANRQNMLLPDDANYLFYDLNYSNLVQCLNYCAYCNREINVHAPGFAYCEKTDKHKNCLFLHVACYDALKEYRCCVHRLAKDARRHFFHFVSSKLTDPTNPKEMAARNEAWLSFLTQYALDFDERHLFNAWLSFMETQEDSPIWQAGITEDLNALTRQLAALSEEALNALEIDLLSIPPPINPLCIIPAPNSRTENGVTCIVYTPRPLPQQLQLNLINALRQARRELPPISIEELK